TRHSKFVPQSIVAASPHDPGVAAFDLISGELNNAVLLLIHVVEVVFICSGERVRRPIGLARFIRHSSWTGTLGPPLIDHEGGCRQQDQNNDEKDSCYSSLFAHDGLLSLLRRRSLND